MYKRRRRKNKKEIIIVDNFNVIDKFTSLVDSLLRLNEEGAGFSDNDICNEIVTMLVAGSETNALTVSFTLIMLAMNPHFQVRPSLKYSEFTNLYSEIKYIQLFIYFLL